MPRQPVNETIEAPDAEPSVVSGGSGLSAVSTVSKQSVTFPTWDSDKREGWQSFAMRLRAFAKRTGRREVYEVAIGTRAIAEFEGNVEFHDADEMLHCDLVLNVKGSAASEILQSSEETFTDAWPRLMREFGSETSVHRMDLVRQLVSIHMDQYSHEMPRYKSACMELSRRVKQADISIDDVIIYSVLYGLDESYDAYKLITQDKIDQGTVLKPEDIIGNLTNSSEVLTHARHLQSAAPIDVLPNGKYSGTANRTSTGRPKSVCEHCEREGHVKKFCWDLHPELAPAYRKAIADAGLPESTSRKVSLREVLQNAQSNQGTKMSFEQVKEAVAKATQF